MAVYTMILRRIGMILTKEQVIEEISKEIDLDISLLQYDNDIVKKIQSINNNIGFFSFECYFDNKRNEKVINIEYEFKSGVIFKNHEGTIAADINEKIEITEKEIVQYASMSSYSKNTIIK